MIMHICLDCLLSHAKADVFYHPGGEGYCEICYEFRYDRYEIERDNTDLPKITIRPNVYLKEWPALTEEEAKWLAEEGVPLDFVPYEIRRRNTD